MGPFLLTPQSIQYLALTVLAGVLAVYLLARSRRAGPTRDLALFFAFMAGGLALLTLDESFRSAKVFIDSSLVVFQLAAAAMLLFAHRFPDVRLDRRARWAVGAAGLTVLADAILAAPDVARSLRGVPNPAGPFRAQLALGLLTVLYIVGLFLWRALAGRGLSRRERGALAGFAGLGVVLGLILLMGYVEVLGLMRREQFQVVMTTGMMIFFSAFVVIHLNASPEPSELMAKLVGLSLVATLLALALTAALSLPPPAGSEAAAAEFQHRQMLRLALLVVGLPAVVLGLFPLLLRAGLRRPLAALLEGVRRMNAGDLSVQVPVRVEDEIGYLARSFNEMVGSVREAVAARERAAAVEGELAIARRIQEELLPAEMPEVEGVATVARLVPATAVSGDFYDAVRTDGGLALLAADVSGHGVPAALIAAMAKLAFSQACPRAGDPAAVLGAMNAALAGRIGAQFFTACGVFLDPARRLVRVGSAGHPPALLLRQGRVQALKPDGPLGGLLPEARFEALEVALAPGDRLLLFTDGVTECCSPADEDFGLERLSDALREGAALAPGAFVDDLLQRLRRWCGRDDAFEDDVTLLVADLLPSPGASPARP